MHEKLIMGLENRCTALGMAEVMAWWEGVREELQSILGLWQDRSVIQKRQVAELVTETVPYFDWTK